MQHEIVDSSATFKKEPMYQLWTQRPGPHMEHEVVDSSATIQEGAGHAGVEKVSHPVLLKNGQQRTLHMRHGILRHLVASYTITRLGTTLSHGSKVLAGNRRTPLTPTTRPQLLVCLSFIPRVMTANLQGPTEFLQSGSFPSGSVRNGPVRPS